MYDIYPVDFTSKIKVENLPREDDAVIVLRKPDSSPKPRLLIEGLSAKLKHVRDCFCGGDEQLFRDALFCALKDLDLPEQKLTSYL